MIEIVNLAEKFSLFSDHWRPRVVGELNGQQVKLARLKGEFVWHHHDDADELFLVIGGTLRMKLPDGEVQVAAGEFIIVPRGVKHLPVADDEVLVLLFEPAATRNTGNVEDERTVADPESI
jgi:mannose-6-phosphate isomerase-like protein (cupin superfamily)